jgi:hypothetical protein
MAVVAPNRTAAAAVDLASRCGPQSKCQCKTAPAGTGPSAYTTVFTVGALERVVSPSFAPAAVLSPASPAAL